MHGELDEAVGVAPLVVVPAPRWFIGSMRRDGMVGCGREGARGESLARELGRAAGVHICPVRAAAAASLRCHESNHTRPDAGAGAGGAGAGCGTHHDTSLTKSPESMMPAPASKIDERLSWTKSCETTSSSV